MKKLFAASVLTVLLSATTFGLLGQEYDVKKDIILKDKVPYAKFGGKVGLSKTNVAVNSLNGDSLIKITKWQYPTDNPQFQLFGYKIQFVNGKSLIKLINLTLINKEQVLNFILKDRDYNTGSREKEFRKDLIVNNALDEAVVDEFITKYNHESVIKEAQEFEAREKEIIAGLYPVTRNKNQPVKLQEVDAETTHVTQDNVFLAAVSRKVETTSMGVKYIYTFYKALNDPFTVGDKKIYKITLATATLDSFPKLYVNVKGKQQDVIVSNPSNAYNELVDVLIKNGYL